MDGVMLGDSKQIILPGITLDRIWDRTGNKIAPFNSGDILDMKLAEIINFKIENVNTLPSPGNTGRIVFLTTDNHLYIDV